MATYILLTKLSPESATSPNRVEKLEHEVQERIKRHCPEVRWVANYAVLGPYDYVDIFEAPDDRSAAKVSTVIRSFGHAITETWTALPWADYKGMLAQLAA
jgi:uncharacterized protein with GYD domain